jgi:hypothetical protein
MEHAVPIPGGIVLSVSKLHVFRMERWLKLGIYNNCGIKVLSDSFIQVEIEYQILKPSC